MGKQFLPSVLNKVSEMKHLFIILYSLLFLLQPILYQLPKTGERRVKNWVGSLPHNTQDSVYFRIGKLSQDPKRVLISCCLFDNDRWSSIAHLSHRFFIIEKKTYPIVLDYDDSFSLTKEQAAAIPGEVGHREGLIKRFFTLFHGHELVIKINKKHHHRLRSFKKLVHCDKDSLSSILYYFNDSTEGYLYSYLDSLPKLLQDSFYAYYSQDNNCCRLVLSSVDNKESWIKERTNRFLIVNETRVPLFFDYDVFLWGEFGQLQMSSEGKMGINIVWNPQIDSPIMNQY